MNQGHLIGALEKSMAAHGAPGSWLGIEINESALMDKLSNPAGKLKQLREMGLQLALDDFGSGYSSQAVRRDVPIDMPSSTRTSPKDSRGPPGRCPRPPVGGSR